MVSLPTICNFIYEKKMRLKLILPGFFLFILPIHAMKRSHSLPNQISNLQNVIEEIIVHHATEYPLAQKPKEATKTVNTLAKTNKKFNQLINNPHNNKKIINNLSYNLYCSHETIARMLWTKQSKEQLRLQHDLRKLCCSTYIFYEFGDLALLKTRKLNELIARNVDLEFTYNRANLQATPLILTAHNADDTMFKILLKQNIDINTCNSHGITLLKFLTEIYPITEFSFNYFKKIIKLPGLKINQQNRHGETALLRCLVHRIPRNLSDSFITIVEELLNAGADPELANNKGLTPRAVAQQLNNGRITDLIKEAIEKKHSNS